MRRNAGLQITAAQKALRGQGRRITTQRALLLRIIEQSGGHLDAEAIYLRAKKENPRLSLSTVYRTLGVLKGMDLVEQRYFARQHQREEYEPKGTPEHYHFTCRGCRKVIEFEAPLMDEVRRDLVRRHHVELTHACMCLEGYCADCRKARR